MSDQKIKETPTANNSGEAIVMRLLQTKENANELIEQLNAFAIEVNHYECGLPTYDDNAMAKMREIIYTWIANA